MRILPRFVRAKLSKIDHSMPLASFYLHKVDQSARLADNAAEPCERASLVSERQAWLRILAGEISTDAMRLEAVLALLPIDDAATSKR
jgi:hypothetical protein